VAELGVATYGQAEPLANLKYLDWKFRRNPYGTIVALCWVDHKAVGCGALIGVPMKIGSIVRKSTIGGDHMVHPDYRRQMIFVDVTRESFKLATNVALTYGTRDLRSPTILGVTKHLGFKVVGEVPVLKRYLTPMSCLADLWVYDKVTLRNLYRYLGSLADLAWISLVQTTISATHPAREKAESNVGERIVVRESDLHFGEEFDRLWEAVQSALPIAVERKKEYLNWRYANPCGYYHVFRAEVDGQLRGFLVLAYHTRRALKTARVLDILSTDPQVGTALVRACIHRAKQDRAHVIKLYKNKLTTNLSRSLGLVEAWVPNHIVCRIVATDLPEDLILDISNWFLTGSDIEDGT
jgi:hypothetical protein